MKTKTLLIIVAYIVLLFFFLVGANMNGGNDDIYITTTTIIGIVLTYYVLRVDGKTNKQIEVDGNSIDKTLKSSADLINSNITKIKKITKQTISKSYITGCAWLLINDKDDNILYTFRTNEVLLVTKNGIVERLSYELIVDNNSILITKNEITEQLDIVNIKDDFLFLRKLSNNEILTFANHTKYRDVVKDELIKLVKKINNGL